MLARITDNEVRVEARAATTSYDILLHVHRMLFRWLGNILRSDPNNQTFKAVEIQSIMNTPGNILQDTPPHTNFQDLIVKVNDKDFWKEHLRVSRF